MKRLIYIFTLSFFSFIGSVIGQDNMIKLDFVETNKHNIFLNNSVSLFLDYAGNLIVTEMEEKRLKENEIVQIDLAYTRFRRNKNFNQEELNSKRIEILQQKFPFIDSAEIKWILVEQTGATTYNEAKNYFHGFTFHFKPKENEPPINMFDLLMGMKVDLPKDIDSSIFNSLCIEQFNHLAQKTNGKLNILASSSDVTETIIKIIQEVSSPYLDLMIIIDKTSSMRDDIINIRKGLKQILGSLEEIDNVRLSISTYGDINVDGAKWYDFNNFENDFEETKAFLDGIMVTGGGDFPESVYDGIYQTFKENFWESGSKRVAILLGDAPSLGPYESSHNAKEIIELANENDIKMNFYPILLSPYNIIGSSVESMAKSDFVNVIYPNPTKGKVTVQFHEEKEYLCEIFNQLGALVFRVETDAQELQLDLSSNPVGLYVIKISDEKKNYDIEKIVLIN